MRRIIGNLDFETRLVIDRARASGGRSTAPPPLAPAVLDTVSSLATLLRALASGGDHLWTPHLVDPGLVEDVPGLPRPVLESGPEVGLKPASALLAWGETSGTALHRSRGGTTQLDATAGSIHPIADWLWTHAPASPEAAARVNHRSFCLKVATELGHALPGARLLDSVAELEGHLAGGGAAASPSGEWVLKAPFSAAGRDRLCASGAAIESDAARRQAENLFARHGSMLFEPWLDRTDDFGCCALLDESECRIVSLHRQEVDGQGRIKALELSRPWVVPGTSDRESATIRSVATEVGRALSGAGYRGPFGIDGWWYRDADGRALLHPLGEINARLSFGVVARVLVDRVASALGEGDGTRWILRFGDPEKRREAGSGRVIPLVKPIAGAGGAWLEILHC